VSALFAPNTGRMWPSHCMAFAQQNVSRITTVGQSDLDQFTAAVVVPEPLDRVAAGHQIISRLRESLEMWLRAGSCRIGLRESQAV
jgi:hypothetical protein